MTDKEVISQNEQNKKTIRKEVKYNSDEWDKMIFLSKKSGKNPAAYIREKTVSGKIMRLDLESMLMNASYDDNSACIDINSVAKNVNTEKAVYLKDVEEAEKGIELLEDYVHNQLRTPVFKEVTEAWL